MSYDSTLWDTVSSGTGARANPLGIIISTQAADDLHWFSGLIDYGRKIQAGDLPPDPSFLLVEYSAPMDADIWDPAVWEACNPALGDFRSRKELEQFADKARKIPAMESVFRNLYLNQRVDSNPAFITREAWKACSDTGETTGPCYGGLDLGSSQDLTALALYWPETGATRVWSWLPGEPSLRDRGEANRAPFHLMGGTRLYRNLAGSCN
jgi:phage terminase large subunit-like protein